MNSVIGIVSCGLDGGRQFVTDTYIRAMETAGGIPLVIPCCQEACCPTFTRLCQGFLFCGGDDVSPLLFGEEPLTGQGRTDWNTDWFHLNFMRQVLKAGLPVLGISPGHADPEPGSRRDHLAGPLPAPRSHAAAYAGLCQPLRSLSQDHCL